MIIFFLKPLSVFFVLLCSVLFYLICRNLDILMLLIVVFLFYFHHCFEKIRLTKKRKKQRNGEKKKEKRDYIGEKYLIKGKKKGQNRKKMERFFILISQLCIFVFLAIDTHFDFIYLQNISITDDLFLKTFFFKRNVFILFLFI